MKTIKRVLAWLFSWFLADPKKWIMYAFLLGPLPVVVAMAWIGFPLSHFWSGLRFPLIEYVRAHRDLHLASYGVAEMLALLMGAEAYRREWWKVVYWAGAALMLVIIAGTLNMAFGEPALMKDLLTEQAWQQGAAAFAQSYLPPAPASEPSVSYSLTFANILQRIQTGWYFTGLGWYAGVLMALVLMICGGLGLDQRSVHRARRLTVLLALGLFVGFLFYPMMGERDLAMAARAEAQWHPDQAKKWYAQAMRDDRWNALDLGVHLRIGALDRATGRTTTPDYHIYRAEVMVEEQRLPEAIEQYEGVAAAGGPLSALARDRAAELWRIYGLNLFDAAAYGAAIAAWRRALAIYPNMWLAELYLSRAYYAVGSYSDATASAQRSIDGSSDPQFLANLYSNLGDAQTRVGDLGPAHASYGKSYYYNYVPNWRAVTSLTGSVAN